MINLNKSHLRQIACFCLLFLFCGHAFCYANLSFSGPSVMVDASAGDRALIENGQFLATLYWRVRGSLAAPLLLGAISYFALTASAILIADMLRITHPLTLLSLCGVLTLHVSVTAINAAMLHMADLYFLSFLFAVLAAWLCLRHSLGFLPAAGFLAASLGMQPSLLAAFPALLLITCMLRSLRGESVQLQTLLKDALSLLTGFALFYVGAMLFARRWGAPLTAHWQLPADTLFAAWLAPLRALLASPTAYTGVCGMLSILLLSICVAALFLIPCTLTNKAFALITALLLPLILCMPVFTSADAAATCEHYVFTLLPIGILALLDLLYSHLKAKRQHLLRIAIACAFGITFLSSIVFANQVYLKKTLEYQTTLSMMTRAIEQAEQTEGFDPGYTPVAIVGTLEDASVAMAHKGFEHLAALDASANNYTASTQAQNQWYFWEIMGYPFNFVSDGQRDALAATEQVQSMPTFPQKGFCAMVDGIMVIKLSTVQ